MSKNQALLLGKLCERIRQAFLYNSWDEVTPILSFSINSESSIGHKIYYDKKHFRSESFRLRINATILCLNSFVYKFRITLIPDSHTPYYPKKPF